MLCSIIMWSTRQHLEHVLNELPKNSNVTLKNYATLKKLLTQAIDLCPPMAESLPSEAVVVPCTTTSPSGWLEPSPLPFKINVEPMDIDD